MQMLKKGSGSCLCFPIHLTDTNKRESHKVVQNISKWGTAATQMGVIMTRNPAKHTEERNKGGKTQRKEEIKTE